jgi:hypothetical protein
MKTYTINIGMNNNNFKSGGMLNILADVMQLLDLEYVDHNSNRIGDYVGSEEPTFVMEFKAKSSHGPWRLACLCTKIFTQECVAWAANDRSTNDLEYHYSFEGEKMKFNYDYFLWVE